MAFFNGQIAAIDVPDLLQQTGNNWPHAMSHALSGILAEADKAGMEATIEDLRPLTEAFRRQGAFGNFPPEKVSNFVTMVIAQYNITKDIGVPLGSTLGKIEDSIQTGELERAKGVGEIEGILELVKSRIDAMKITEEIRAMLLQWLNFHKVEVSPKSLNPEDLKGEMDDLARSWASKVRSGEYFGDQNSSPVMQEWFDSNSVVDRVPPTAKMDMQFYTMLYEVMKWATEKEIPFALKNAVQLAGEFEKVIDMNKPGTTHALYMQWAPSAFWRGKMAQEVGLALPPFEGIQRMVVMAIANGSLVPLNNILTKIVNVEDFGKDKSLGEDTLKDLQGFGKSCLQFARKAFNQCSNPTTFAQTVFEHMATIARGFSARSKDGQVDQSVAEKEIIDSVIARFGVLFRFHQEALSKLLLQQGGTVSPEGANDEDIAKDCLRLFVQKTGASK